MSNNDSLDGKLINFGLYAENYKAFSARSGIPVIRPITLLIGRNNSGKSSLLDLFETACKDKGTGGFEFRGGGHNGHSPLLWLSYRPTEQVLTAVGANAKSLNRLSYRADSWHQYAEYWDGKTIYWTRDASARTISDLAIDVHIEEDVLRVDHQGSGVRGTAKSIVLQVVKTLAGMRFVRLAAEKNIQPEADSADPKIAEDGSGVTTLIRHFANKANRDPSRVTEVLLRELNEIMRPDSEFRDLLVRQLEDDRWEVYLNEERKGLVPLSQSGSGLKTVPLVLSHLHLSANQSKLENYIFGFEELENNLHPALQRRLFSYLREFALQNGCHFVLTTHSNVVVDLFADDEIATIVHVTHDGSSATATPVLTHSSRHGVLDDLDVRASDLLQSNGIVWVEGPTDRMYFNRWIELWTDGELEEGNHYQCMFYGGRLLSHLSASEPSDSKHAIEIVRVNRNAIVIIDSDRKKSTTPLNPTKNRILEEIEEVGGYGWVTAGREIEHYVPVETLRQIYGEKATGPQQFASYSEYLNGRRAGEGSRYKRNKVAFAERVIPLLTREGITVTYDLAERLDSVVSRIRQWNRLPPPAPPEEDQSSSA